MSRPAPGTVFGGDFEVVRPLGSGGMGSVYEVRQTSTGALRALKTMRPDLARSEGFRKRFAQEATITSRIESDHIVHVISAGIEAAGELEGTPWIAMELVRGKELEDHVRARGPLAAKEAREILAQICHALGAAHAEGIVHRDLKPQNVLVAEGKSAAQKLTVKILDFGIAKLITAADATATGAMGTPLWMAPEQTTTGSAISGATDVWALGLLAFYVLTGRSYWRTANLADATPVQLLKEISIDPLESASARATSVGRTLPDGFDAWFARCVVREPAARFANAREAAGPLDALLAAAEALAPKADLAFEKTVPFPQDAAPVRTAIAFADATDPERHEKRPSRDVSPARPRRTLRIVVAIAFAAVVVVGLRSSGALSRLLGRSAPEGAGALGSSSTAGAARARARSAPMIRVAGALFTKGSDAGPMDERPPTEVSVAGFALDVHEVTVAEYLACLAAGACTPAGDGADCNGLSEPNREAHPINCVTFVQAKAYCAWVDKRLPSESEWELAARGPSNLRFPWGNEPPVDHACWRRGEGAGEARGTCRIGTFSHGRSPHGLTDMAGNVWEWTSDRYCPYANASCTDERRVLRGGSWTTSDPALMTTTVRREAFENDHGASIGMRCARTL
jgi:eukaryotic-like serine/threonine-protein kinase